MRAYLHKRRQVGEREEVDIKLVDANGNPAELGGGGGVSQYISGVGLQKSVLGVNAYLDFDGSDPGIDIVGFESTSSQAIELPPGIYTSSWQIGFDVTDDDGVGDVTRLFTAQVQPLGRQLEKSWIKPAGGWADSNPYIFENLAWNFIVPATGNDLIVGFDGTTAGDNGVDYYLTFMLAKLGDLPS